MNNRQEEKQQFLNDFESSYLKIGRDCKGPLTALVTGHDRVQNFNQAKSNIFACMKEHDTTVSSQKAKSDSIGPSQLDNGLYAFSKVATQAGKCSFFKEQGYSDLTKSECYDIDARLNDARDYASSKIGL